MATTILSRRERAFNVVVYLFFILFACTTLYPLLNILAISASDHVAYLERPTMVVPRNLNVEAYRRIIRSPVILTAYANSLFVTVAGTAVVVLFTIITAYPLAKAKVKGTRAFMFFFMVTMFFSGGLIPTYLVVKGIGMVDTRWALIIPSAGNMFYILVMKSYFETLPSSLEDSAKIDGASDLTTLFRIIVPIATPVVATIILFAAVGHWNSWFNVLIYITNRRKWTLMFLLREIIAQDFMDILDAIDPMERRQRLFPEAVKSASIMLTVIPILLVYPFLQRYYIRGVMLGSLKS
jgi:putative aldouronate transport system permease protein